MTKETNKFHALQLFTDTFTAETVHLTNEKIGMQHTIIAIYRYWGMGKESGCAPCYRRDINLLFGLQPNKSLFDNSAWNDDLRTDLVHVDGSRKAQRIQDVLQVSCAPNL